ncbi:unnamed protein product [Malus baccata var. baccata]
MSRLPFPSSVNRASEPFHKVHSDVWWPSQHFSLMTSQDVHRFIPLLINLIYVLYILISFMLILLPSLPSLAAKSIQHYKSCRYTSQQNGMAERKYHHLIETIIACCLQLLNTQILVPDLLSWKVQSDSFPIAASAITKGVDVTDNEI